jgi:Na+/melibiose symporter-like transporter
LNPFSAVALVAFGFSVFNLIWIALRFREPRPDGRPGDGATERTRHPLRALFAIGDPAVRRANLVYFLMALTFAGFEMMLSFYATERLNYNERQLTYVFVFIGVVSIFTQGFLVRRLVPRLGERLGALAGVVMMAAGCAWLAAARAAGGVYGALALVSIGSGFANVSFSSLISLYSPPDRQGHVLGVFRSLGSLARAVGPVVAGIIFWWSGSTFTCALGAVLLLVPAVAGLGLPQPKK